MYITTSRKPSLNTKRLCRTLSYLFPRGIYENRGKKSIDQIASRAKKLGKSRVLLVYEENGNPDKIAFMAIGKEWSWLNPEIKLKKLGNSIKDIPKAKELGVTGKMSGKLSTLFNLEYPEGDIDIHLTVEKTKWIFSKAKKEIFSFGVIYV